MTCAGRLYVCSNCVLVSLSSLWGAPRLLRLEYEADMVHQEGRALLFAGGEWVYCSYPAECCAAIREASAAALAGRAACRAVRAGEAAPAALLALGAWLSAHCEEEGIFRVSGSMRVVRRLWMRLEEGETPQLRSTADAASLFKV